MSANNPTITDAILSLVPNAEVFVYGDNINYEIIWNNPSVAPVTNEQINAELLKLEAEIPFNDCKLKAISILTATDWTSIPDVGNPSASNPYLLNQGAFIAYRSQIRALAVNPVANPVWPTQPTEQWSS